MPGNLEGKVALVTGASRGAGRGIALALGDCGATVYCAARSVRGESTAEDLPGTTVDDTAEAVTSRGGRGIPVRCDCTSDADVRALFARISEEHGRLDLVVNNSWGGYENYDYRTFGARFWKQPFEQRWHGMIEAGLRGHLLTTYHAIPLMLPRRSGVIVSTIAWNDGQYLGNLFYDLSKGAIVRMILGLGEELRPHDITAMAVAPGFMRTERLMAAHSAYAFDLTPTESPEYIGRVIAALAADLDVSGKSGQTFYAGDLAREYGIRDVDERWIPPFKSKWFACSRCSGKGLLEDQGECPQCRGFGRTPVQDTSEAASV